MWIVSCVTVPCIFFLCRSQTNFENFCRSTSMHGWFYVVDDSLGKGFYASCTRVLWVLVVMLSILLTMILVGLTIAKYLETKVASSYVFERGNWLNVEFPAVTVCSKNLVSLLKEKDASMYS